MQDPNQQQTTHGEHDAPQQGAGNEGGHGSTEAGHGAEDGTSSIFNSLLNSLGDHRELSFGPWPIVDLPVILIDEGVHVYSSTDAMQEEGLYEFTHHHIYKAGTETPPALDLSITSLVFYQWVAMFVLLAIFIPMSKKYKKNGIRPLKGFFNMIEALVVYVRDEIIVPNVGKDKLGQQLLPILMTFFFFILTMNLIGLIPGGHTATGSLNVTGGLAIIAFIVIQGSSIKKNGVVAWLKHLTAGTPVALWPIMVPVEILGLFTKPFALCVRLFANMTAGHIILLSLTGLIFVTTVFIPVSLGFALFINLLELLVVFLQAYIFTVLTAVFIGMGIESHDHHDEQHATAH